MLSRQHRTLRVSTHPIVLDVHVTNSEVVTALERRVTDLESRLRAMDAELMRALIYAPKYLELSDMLIQAKYEMSRAGLDVSWLKM